MQKCAKSEAIGQVKAFINERMTNRLRPASKLDDAAPAPDAVPPQQSAEFSEEELSLLKSTREDAVKA